MFLLNNTIMSTLLTITVIPRSSRRTVTKDLEGGYRVTVHAAPEKGKANKEVLEVLAEYFCIKKSQVELVSGHTSRNKVVKIP